MIERDRTVRLGPRQARRLWLGGLIGGPAFQSTATSVGSSLLGALTGLLSARYLGPVGRGELAVALSVLGIVVQTCDLSIVQTGSYFIAKGRPAGVVFGTGVPILLLLASAAVPLAVIALHLFGYEGHTLRLNSIVLINVPVMLIGGLASVIPLGLGQYRTWNLLRLMLPIAFAVAVVTIGFGLGNWTADAIIVGYLISSAIAVTLVAVAARKQSGRLHFSAGFAKEWLRYSSSIHFGGLAGNFNLKLDLVLIGAVLGSRDAGIYAVAVGFATPVTFVAASYAAIALPEIAKRSGAERYEFAGSTMRKALVFSFILAAIGALAAPAVIPRLVGPAFRDSVNPFRVLLVAQIVLSINGVLASTHLGLGRPIVPTVAEFVSLAVTVPLLVLFLRRWGLVGASGICIITYGASFLVLWLCFVKYRRMDTAESEPRTTWRDRIGNRADS